MWYYIILYYYYQSLLFVFVQEFEKIECEWPLFFLYMIIEGMFKGNEEQVEQYKNKLKPLVKRDKWGGEYW